METGERTPIFTNTYTTSEETDKQTYRSIRFVWRVAVFLLGAGFLGYLVYWFIRMLQWSALSGRPIYTESLFWICLSGFSIYGFLIVREILCARGDPAVSAASAAASLGCTRAVYTLPAVDGGEPYVTADAPLIPGTVWDLTLD